MGLTYTLVSTCVSLLSSWMPKKGSILFLSISMVNLIEEWHWFKISRKLSADALFSMMVDVLSTNLL